MPFMDKMFDTLTRKEWNCFLDGYSGYKQNPIGLEDQEKTIFTCPYGTFILKRIPFGLCNALVTFLRCMVLILFDMVEETIEVSMYVFFMVGDSSIGV